MTSRTQASCPSCGHPHFPVIHNQISRDGQAVYRKRECDSCHYWLSTEERLIPHRRNKYEERLVEVYRRLNHNKRKALWGVLKVMK